MDTYPLPYHRPILMFPGISFITKESTDSSGRRCWRGQGLLLTWLECCCASTWSPVQGTTPLRRQTWRRPLPVHPQFPEECWSRELCEGTEHEKTSWFRLERGTKPARPLWQRQPCPCTVTPWFFSPAQRCFTHPPHICCHIGPSTFVVVVFCCLLQVLHFHLYFLNRVQNRMTQAWGSSSNPSVSPVSHPSLPHSTWHRVASAKTRVRLCPCYRGGIAWTGSAGNSTQIKAKLTCPWIGHSASLLMHNAWDVGFFVINMWFVTLRYLSFL